MAHPITAATALAVFAIPFAARCNDVPTPADPCVINFGHDDVDQARDTWIAAHQPLDYTGSRTGVWVDLETGRIIGWSAQEDSAICAFVP